MLGLALAGFGVAGYLTVAPGIAASSPHVDTASTAVTTTRPVGGLCTRAHPCANPGCAEAGYGPHDCQDVTTAATTTASSTTTQSTTTTTRTTTTIATTPTQPLPTTTADTTIAAALPPSPPPTTTPVETVPTTPLLPTATSQPATTTQGDSAPAAPFVPPRIRRRTPRKALAAHTLPYTGMNLTVVLGLAVGLLGAGCILMLAGRVPHRRKVDRGAVSVSSSGDTGSSSPE